MFFLLTKKKQKYFNMIFMILFIQTLPIDYTIPMLCENKSNQWYTAHYMIDSDTFINNPNNQLIFSLGNIQYTILTDTVRKIIRSILEITKTLNNNKFQILLYADGTIIQYNTSLTQITSLNYSIFDITEVLKDSNKDLKSFQIQLSEINKQLNNPEMNISNNWIAIIITALILSVVNFILILLNMIVSRKPSENIN